MSTSSDTPRTANGVEITEGLVVINSNMERVTLTLRRAFFETGYYHGKPTGKGEWWFYDTDGGMTSESRVTTRHPFTGESPDEMAARKNKA